MAAMKRSMIRRLFSSQQSFLLSYPPRRIPSIVRSFKSVGERFDWNDHSPLRVSSIYDADIIPFDPFNVRGDGQHYLILVVVDDLELHTEADLFNYYINLLSKAVGSEYEARKRIYLVSCGLGYGFGTKLEHNELNKLSRLRHTYLHVTYPDQSFSIRNTENFAQSAQSVIRFVPPNPDNCLDNIFSYHYQSLKSLNFNWNHDHWLINIKRPDGNHQEVYQYCTRMLAEVVGSEEAHKKIYIIWFKSPFGFAAEIDEESSNKLKGRRDVLDVIPDYKFDIKDKRSPALHVISSSHGLRFSRYIPTEDNSEDWLVCMDEHVDQSHYIYYRKPYVECGFDVKKWLVVIEKVCGEFISFQQKIDCGLQTLSSVFGREDAYCSKEETVKRKIYRIQCGHNYVVFGIKMDEETSNTLKGQIGITAVLEDNSDDRWNKDACVQSAPCLDHINWNISLKDLFSYHHLSERNSEWKFDHWLIHIKQPHDKFQTEQEIIDFCISMLSEVLQSCKIDAGGKIYIVWCDIPFGFAAEIDEETSNKLKGHPDVLIVLPDYASHTQNRECGVLAISPSSWVGPTFQSMSFIEHSVVIRSPSDDEISDDEDSLCASISTC